MVTTVDWGRWLVTTRNVEGVWRVMVLHEPCFREEEEVEGWEDGGGYGVEFKRGEAGNVIISYSQRVSHK